MTYQLRTSDESVLICPGAAVTGDVVLGKGVSVWYNAVIRGDDGTITVGEDTNIQDCAVLHETTTVGRRSPPSRCISKTLEATAVCVSIRYSYSWNIRRISSRVAPSSQQPAKNSAWISAFTGALTV